MPTSNSNPPTLSRKDQARQMRRAAYQRAKQQRANDPRLIALKAALKTRRREAYQAAKARKKTAAKELQSKLRAAAPDDVPLDRN